MGTAARKTDGRREERKRGREGGTGSCQGIDTERERTRKRERSVSGYKRKEQKRLMGVKRKDGKEGKWNERVEKEKKVSSLWR